MKILISVYISILLAGGGFAHPMENTHEPREATRLEKETFHLLKKKFPGEILDQNLKTLNEIAQMPEYQDFLTKAYPVTKPIQEIEEIINFEKTVNKILPPKESYLTYYTEYFHIKALEEVEDFEHLFIHLQLTDNWVYHAIKLGEDISRNARPKETRLPSIMKLMKTPLFRKMMEARFGISAKLEMSPDVMTEIVRYVGIPMHRMTKVLLSTDAHRISTLFKKHGSADGMLWIAIQYPVLFERIRYAFTTNTTFINYLHAAPIAAEADAQREQELRKWWQQQQKEQPNQ